MTRRKIQYWVIPPKANSEFAASMEEVLETYARPYDAAHPVICMDEQPVQLTKETRVPVPATREHSRRGLSVRSHRWAFEMEALLRTRYSAAEKVILISDNLNTQTKGAFYEAFAPDQTRALVKRLEFRHTPKHGS